MRLSLPSPTCLGLLLLVLACSGGGGSSRTPTQPGPGNPGGASLRGTVHVAGTDSPVPGVVVLAQNGRATTIADGSFAIENLSPGATQVSLSRDGFVERAVQVNLTAGDNQASFTLEQDPGGPCDDIAGAWDGSWEMECDDASGENASDDGPVPVTQAGCFVILPVPGLGTFSGELAGGVSDSELRLDFEAGAPGADDLTCTPDGSGALTLASPTMARINFSAPCCRHGLVDLKR